MIRCLVSIFFIFVLNESNLSNAGNARFVTSSTTTIFSKTICSNQALDSDNYETIRCPGNYKINIQTSILYDSENRNSCISFQKSDIYINRIKNILQDYCRFETNCTISKIFVIDVANEYSSIVQNPNIDVSWSCYIPTSTDSMISPDRYGFTYFFYIVTLVFSTSCILVGAIFILRKFIILRRRNNFNQTVRTRRNHAGNDANSNAHTVWTTSAYPPPAYDNIYETSLPIHPLPNYESTFKVNFDAKMQDENKVVLSTDQTENLEPYEQQEQADRVDETSQPVNLEISTANNVINNKPDNEVLVKTNSKENQSEKNIKV